MKGRNSSGDERRVHPYLRKVFYTYWMFSQRENYTPKARLRFANQELEEQRELERLNKSDCYGPKKIN